MRILSINASLPNYDNNLYIINKIIHEIFKELEINIFEINLFDMQIPYYNGNPSDEVSKLMEIIRQSNGLILISPVNINAPCSLMQNFMEYFAHKSFSNILLNKNCALVMASEVSGEKTAIDYMSNLINGLGGYDSVKIPLNSINIELIGSSNEYKEIIIKQLEDFYRIIKQNRKYIIPAECLNKFKIAEEQVIIQPNPNKKFSIDDIYKKYNLDELDNNKKNEINEVSKIFSEKYNIETKSPKEFFSEPFDDIIPEKSPVVATPKTCKQLLGALPHKFQSNSAKDLNFVMQFIVSGTETFEGTVSVINKECFFEDGMIVEPDVTLISDSDILKKILNGEQSAQKSFMVGQIKVRGNFVLLSKFDLIFKL